MLAAGGTDTHGSRRALAELCEAYWYPIYAFVRRQGSSAEDAADLTQGYLLQLLEKGALKGLRPEAGRFRSFLFASIKNFLSNERDRDRALKRGGGRAPFSLDAEAAESRYRIEAADDLTPEKLFERRWATTVLQRAMVRMRSEIVDVGDIARFDKLKAYLSGDGLEPAYRTVASELGMTESAVGVAVHRLRRRFGESLRAEIGETVADPREIDEEIRYLLTSLGEA